MKRKFRSFREIDGKLFDEKGMAVSAYRRTKYSMKTAVEHDTLHVEIEIGKSSFFFKKKAENFMFCCPDRELHGEIPNPFERNYEEDLLKRSVLKGDFVVSEASKKYLEEDIWNEIETVT